MNLQKDNFVVLRLFVKLYCLFFQGFEDNIRKNRTVISNWIKYAQWEESLKEIQRYCSWSQFYCKMSVVLQLPVLSNHRITLHLVLVMFRVSVFWQKGKGEEIWSYIAAKFGLFYTEFLLQQNLLWWSPLIDASSFFRARSIYERALDVDHRNITLWLKYAEMEMKSRQVNHARNIWDRAITILPRVNQFWYEWNSCLLLTSENTESWTLDSLCAEKRSWGNFSVYL